MPANPLKDTPSRRSVSTGRKENDGRSKNPYDYEKHHKMLMACADRGESISYFCLNAGISRHTCAYWQKKYPEFKESVDEYRLRLARWYDQLAKDNLNNNKDFNNALYTRLLRTAKISDEYVRLPGLQEAKTYEDKIAVIHAAVSDGELGVEASNRLINMLKISTEIEQNVDVKKTVDKLKEMQGIE